MFCANCGLNVADDVVLCPKCGRSAKGDDVVVATRNQQSGYPLSNLTASAFRVLFEIILWFILIGGFIFGGIIGYQNGNAFMGIIGGGVLAFIIIIITGGLVSLLIKLVDNAEDIKRKLK